MMSSYLAAGLASGIEQGMGRIDARDKENFRRKTIAENASRQQQQLDMQQQQHNQQMQHNQQNQNVAMSNAARQEEMIQGIMKEQQQSKMKMGKAAMGNAVAELWRNSGTDKVGSSVNRMNSIIQESPELYEMMGDLGLPNPNNPQHMKSVQAWAMQQQGEDAVPLGDEALTSMLTSGQFLINKNGVIADTGEMAQKLGLMPLMPVDSMDRFQATLHYNNSLALASQGKIGQTNAPNDHQRLANLNALENPTPAQVIEKDAINKDLKITKESANSYLTGTPTAPAREAIADGDFSKVERKDADLAMKAQLDSGIALPNEIRKETYGAIPTIKAGNKALEDMSKVPDDELRGYVDKLELKAKSLFSDKSFDELSFKEQARVMSTVETNSRLGTIFSSYVQSISGAAVADQEFARLALNAFGGDLQNVNLQTLTTAFTSFIGEVQGRAKNSIQAMSPRYTGYQMDLANKTADFKRPVNPFKVRAAEGMAKEANRADYVADSLALAKKKGRKPTDIRKVGRKSKTVELYDGTIRPMTKAEEAKVKAIDARKAK